MVMLPFGAAQVVLAFVVPDTPRVMLLLETTAFAVPVAVDNDANVAAVGEWWLGAGRGGARVTMVTIGTGIGVATLIGGRIQRSTKGQHGEAGHVHGPNCNHGHDHHHHHHHAGETFVRAAAKIGRNEPCPCGSGKKHKKCCRGVATVH